MANLTNTAVGNDVNVFEQVTYQIRDWNETKALIAEQQGKVVVVDLWSSSCLPCMREFPNLVSLQEKHGDKIACISVNVNYLGIKSAPSEQMQEQVLTFLKKHDARIYNIISSVPDEKLAQQLEFASIPIVYVHDKSGKLRKRFDNEQVKKAEDEFTYEKNVIPLVEQLLADD